MLTSAPQVAPLDFVTGVTVSREPPGPSSTPSSSPSCSVFRSRRSKFEDYRSVMLVEDFERLTRLKQSLSIPFDSSNPVHERMLEELWTLAFPLVPLTQRRTSDWKRLGFQGTDPATDFRGGGVAALQMMLYFARDRPDTFARMVAVDTAPEYGFALCVILCVHILQFRLCLLSTTSSSAYFKNMRPSRKSMATFASLFSSYKTAFEDICSDAVELADLQWNRLKASKPDCTLLDFPEVIRAMQKAVDRAFAGVSDHATFDEFRELLAKDATKLADPAPSTSATVVPVKLPVIDTPTDSPTAQPKTDPPVGFTESKPIDDEAETKAE